jgi:hypothetical protein
MKSLSTQRADAVITFVRRGCACKHFEYSLVANVIVLGDEREKVDKSTVKKTMMENRTACITDLSKESALTTYLILVDKAVDYYTATV